MFAIASEMLRLICAGSFCTRGVMLFSSFIWIKDFLPAVARLFQAPKEPDVIKLVTIPTAVVARLYQ